MSGAVIAGAGMTAFGKHRERTLRDLVAEAVGAALDDAGAHGTEVGAVFFGNAAAGLLSGQEMLRGQFMLQGTPLEGAPIVNVENACASSSTAARLAWRAVVTGDVEVAVAVGAEKMSQADRQRPFRALAGALDVERAGVADFALARDEPGEGPPASVFMEMYAADARGYMERTGATAEDFAAVVAKTRHHGALNPRAQYRSEVTPEQVLAERVIAAPLTRDMCSPIGDGAACLVIAADGWRGAAAADTVRIRAMAIGSGVADGRSDLVPNTAARAYAAAGLGPDDLDLVEVHDAAASAELMILEELGLAGEGEAPALTRSGATALGGARPVNTSGGLISRGHPIGATGAAQLFELVEQLRGRAGSRQVQGARVALAENAGGHLGAEPAACVVSVLSRD